MMNGERKGGHFEALKIFIKDWCQIWKYLHKIFKLNLSVFYAHTKNCAKLRRQQNPVQTSGIIRIFRKLTDPLNKKIIFLPFYHFPHRNKVHEIENPGDIWCNTSLFLSLNVIGRVSKGYYHNQTSLRSDQRILFCNSKKLTLNINLEKIGIDFFMVLRFKKWEKMDSFV